MSLACCAAQFFFSAGLAYSECFLLAVMAYDRYVAICNPLLYAIAMPKKLCIQLVTGSYIAGFANAIVHVGNTFRLHFCGNNVINHYFCDVPPLEKMACDDIRVYELILTTVIGCCLLATTVLILGSYTGIVAAIIRIRSAAGRRKAFSTCSAHLTSVSVFFGSMLFSYCRPSSQHTPNWDKATALLYTVLNPLINPFAGSYVVGFANAIVHTGNTFRLRFCGNNIINHFLCDEPPLVKMACDDTRVYELIVTIIIGCNLLATTVLILGSYTAIVAAITRIRSAAGRRKAFSTCSAHLISVSLFYGAILFTYSRPSSQHTPNWDKACFVLHGHQPPVNPLIYSLCNRDVKSAFKKVLGRFIRRGNHHSWI